MSDTGVIEVLLTTAGTVEIATGPLGERGQRGPAGDTGPAGNTSYAHAQAVSATVWLITHELGYDPAGLLVISDGYVMDGCGVQVLEPGVSLRLSFDISLAGTAYLS